MSKVYEINDATFANSKLIPSMEYIRDILKMIEDAIIESDNFKGFSSIDNEIESIELAKESEDAVFAKDIETDGEHQFVSETFVNILKDKPSSFDVQQSIDSAKEDIKKDINDIYMRIINTPNVISKLRDIADILNEDDIASGLLNTIALKVSTDEFNEHIKSSTHLNNNDRKALNLFIKFIANGGLDWNTEETAFGGIKNKPTSLPANGGNADTVGDVTVRDISSANIADVVIGSNESDSKYCDFIIGDDNADDVLNSVLKNISSKYTILFRSGIYSIKTVSMFSDSVLNIIGCGDVIINAKTFTVNNVSAKDICIKDSFIRINKNCNLHNVNFVNCEIEFYYTEDTDITGCTFNNCKFNITGELLRNIITLNRFTNSDNLRYIGGDNIILNNIGNN
jgi:hypothetical protein